MLYISRYLFRISTDAEVFPCDFAKEAFLLSSTFLLHV